MTQNCPDRMRKWLLRLIGLPTARIWDVDIPLGYCDITTVDSCMGSVDKFFRNRGSSELMVTDRKAGKRTRTHPSESHSCLKQQRQPISKLTKYLLSHALLRGGRMVDLSNLSQALLRHGAYIFYPLLTGCELEPDHAGRSSPVRTSFTTRHSRRY